MTEPTDENLTASERSAREALAALTPPAAEPQFRARLREAFVTGEASPSPARVPRLPWHWRPMTHWTLAAAAVAATLLLVATLNQGGEWRVVSAHGAGSAMVDGQVAAGGDVAALERRLRAGARIELPAGSDLVLRAGDQWLMGIESGTSLTLPAIPGRWFSRQARGAVDAGEIRMSTAPAFHGAALALATPEAEVRVTGTTLAVICESGGTCVCVIEGTVRMGARRGAPALAPVAAGMRGYAFADGRPMMQTTMRADEVPALGALRERRRALLEARAR